MNVQHVKCQINSQIKFKHLPLKILEENISIDREILKKRYISPEILKKNTEKKDKKLLMIKDQYNNIRREYQKIINLFENTLNQPSKFGTKNLVGMNDDSRGTCNINS